MNIKMFVGISLEKEKVVRGLNSKDCNKLFE